MELPSRPKGSSFGNRLYNAQVELAQRYEYIPSFKKFLSTTSSPEAQQKISHTEFTREQSFLGFTDLEYSKENVFAPSLSPISFEGGKWIAKPPVILIVAPKGAGKTSLMKVIVEDNFYARFGLQTLVIDPAPNAEWYLSKYPITNVFPKHADKITEFYSQFKVSPEESWVPKGYNVKAYAAQFTRKKLEEGVDYPYQPTIPQLTEIWDEDQPECENIVLSILGEEENKLSRFWTDEIFLRHKKKISEVLAMQDDEALKKELGDGTSFFRAFNNAVKLGVVGDFSVDRSNILKDMHDGDIGIFRSPSGLDGEDSSSSSKQQLTTKVLFTSSFNDRRAYISGTAYERKNAYLDCPKGFQIASDEIDKLAGRKDTYTRRLFRAYALKGRKNVMPIIGATQDISLVDPHLVKSADYIFFAKPEENANSADKESGTIEYLRDKYGKGMLEIFKQMPFRQKNSLVLPSGEIWEDAFEVSQFCMTSREKGIVGYFYSNLPRSAIRVSEI